MEFLEKSFYGITIGYIFLFFFFLVIVLLVIFRTLKVDIEKGKKAVHHENCGGFFGLFNYPISLVRFAIYDDFLVIKYLRSIVLKLDEIDHVEIKKRRFNYGIHIIHKKQGVPQMIYIWSRNGELVEKILKSKEVKLV